MKNPKPRFSIVIPCYNEAKFIGRTLTSIQRQQYSGSYEVIIVDNNCTDRTSAIAKSYGVKVINEQRRGVCWARQAGTKVASGEVVVSTDADTTFPKDWLQKIDTAFGQHPKCVAVAGPCAYDDGPWWGKQYPRILFGLVSFLFQTTGRPFYITATNIAFKKSAWVKYDTSLTQGGDELALLHDLRKKGKVNFNRDNPVYTSGRRLERGLFYNLFVTFFLYYMMGYYLNRITGRTIVGMAPAYRTPATLRSRLAFIYRSSFLILAVALIHLPGHDTLLQQAYETSATLLRYI